MEVETPLHVLRDCSYTRHFWFSFPQDMLIPEFSHLDLPSWCKRNEKINTRVSYVPWGVLFAFTVWAIWLSRNSLVFSGKLIPFQALRNNSLSHDTEFYFLSTSISTSTHLSTDIWIRWCPGACPYITINTDGSAVGNPGPAGTGGLARSHTGEWLRGFLLKLGWTSNTVAELWGIREALCKAWRKGHRRILLQTDSLLAVTWLNNSSDFPVESANLVSDCRWLLRQEWEVRVEHIWREANGCADLLAKRGSSQMEREILYDICPTFLWRCLY